MGEQVKKLRKTLGLTMEQFGARLGVGKTAICKIEKGENNLTDQMLKSICNVNWDDKFVNEDWLRGNSDEMFRPDSNEELDVLVEKYNLFHSSQVVIEKFVEMKESERQILLSYYTKIISAFSKSDISNNASTFPTVDLNKLSLNEKVE